MNSCLFINICLNPVDNTTHSSLNHIKELIAAYIFRLTKAEPIDYLIEQKQHRFLTLKTSNNVFIPRLDTDCLLEYVLNLLPNKILTALDLGSGSGTIVLGLAYERTKWLCIGSDLSIKTLAVTKYNASNLNLNAVRYLYSNWFSSLYMKGYDIIITNPPYISKKDMHLDKGELRFETNIWLASSNNGLQALFNICTSSIFFLTYGGWLLLEHGYSQGSIIRAYLLAFSFKDVHSIKDYNNNERITIGRLL